MVKSLARSILLLRENFLVIAAAHCLVHRHAVPHYFSALSCPGGAVRLVCARVQGQIRIGNQSTVHARAAVVAAGLCDLCRAIGTDVLFLSTGLHEDL